MKKSCDNCIFLKQTDWNMINPIFYSCLKGLSYNKDMFKDNCKLFEPTLKASNTEFLKELHINFTNGLKRKSSHLWCIVDDMSKTYKRISGNHNFFLWFETERELDEFYNENIELIRNCNLKKI